MGEVALLACELVEESQRPSPGLVRIVGSVDDLDVSPESPQQTGILHESLVRIDRSLQPAAALDRTIGPVGLRLDPEADLAEQPVVSWLTAVDRDVAQAGR